MARVNLAAAALATAMSTTLSLLPSAAHAAVVTRGPYLQTGTPSGVVVRWRTDVATTSRVEYGNAPGALVAHVDIVSSTTEHVVPLSGLSPDTKLFYAVGSTTTRLAGNDSTYFFVTAPADGTPKPTRIWILGDSGTASGGAGQVRDHYYAWTGSRHTDLWVMLGDNAYPAGADSSYQTALFDFYPTMLRKSVLWPAFGNHDAMSASSGTQTGPYYDMFTLPRYGEAGGAASGTEAYYSFNYGDIHFVCLDSHDSPRTVAGPMLTWLIGDLAADHHDWCIAFWHHPPYSKGSHNSDNPSDSQGRLVDMRENALPLLEAHGVDMVLCGHSHSYERSFLLDEHYGYSVTLDDSMILNGGDGRETGDGAYRKPTLGPAPHEGAVYVVAGSSGQTSGGPLDHPAMFLSLNSLGSVALDISGTRLDATFVDDAGVLRDRFTMIKGTTGGTPHPPVPTAGLYLSPNDPNPFTAHTSLTFHSETSQEVTLEVFNVSGRMIARAFHGMAPAGTDVRVTLDGSAWGSGLYFAQLRSAEGEVRRPMVLIR